MALAQPTNFRYDPEKFNYEEMVYGTRSQQLCQQMTRLAIHLLASPVFNLGLSQINLIDQDIFKARSNIGKVLLRSGELKDLGNTCYCTLWQLCLLGVKKYPDSHQTKRSIEAVIQKYPALGDKWLQTLHSLVLKGDVIEYVLWCVLAAPVMTPNLVTDAMQLNTLLCEWYACWTELLNILAGHWEDQLSDSKLPTCRSLAQLIGLSAIVTRLSPEKVDAAFVHYTRG